MIKKIIKSMILGWIMINPISYVIYLTFNDVFKIQTPFNNIYFIVSVSLSLGLLWIAFVLYLCDTIKKYVKNKKERE